MSPNTYLSRVDNLIRRGRQLRDTLAQDPSSIAPQAATRLWQQDCAALVNSLSGGSKAHWLAREYSQAFLVRSAGGGVIEEVRIAEIVQRILHVLDQAASSLSQMSDVGKLDSHPSSTVGPQSDEGPPLTDDHRLAEPPRARRFEFVHNTALRPVLEQAYVDSRRALEQGHFGKALMVSCGVLEAVITDALDHAGQMPKEMPEGRLGDWPFDRRIAAAESAGLIHGGCARLPPIALKYRNLADEDGAVRAGVQISEREARLTSQVLHVIMRDLDPGR